MDNYTMFGRFENPRRGMQARNLTTNVPKILDLKSYFRTDIFQKLSLGAPEICVKRSPIRYSFSAGATAMPYNVNIAFIVLYYTTA